MDLQSLLPPDLFLQVRGLTPGRVASLVPVLLGLISLIIGWTALARAGRTGSRRRNPVIALVLGGMAVIYAIIRLVRTTGDIGTGSGKLGAIIAVVLGSVGIILAFCALKRLQRMTGGDSRK
jgi:4-amino-4-deoxy-L-arabinose transferase-like glycosyltransferase